MRQHFRVHRASEVVVLLGLLLSLAPATAPSADATNPVCTLDTLVTEALQSNPELNFYQAEIAAAKAGRRAAGKLANPEISGDLGYKRDENRSGQFLGDGVAWSVSVAQPFDFPGRMALRKAIANRQTAIAELGLGQFRSGLAARVRELGFKRMVAQENARAAREVRDRVQELLAVLVQRDPAGITPLLETRVIEANAVTLQRRATLAAQAEQSALLELNQACGRPLEARFQIAPTELKFPAIPPLDTLLAAARTNNFDLRIRAAELEQQGFRVELDRKERWASVKLAPFYSNERGADDESVVGVGVSLPLPLWDRRKASVEQSKARLQQAETSLHVTQRQLERQVTERALAYEKLLGEMNRWRTNAVAQFREAAELGDRHYRMGALPVSTYLELQQQYVEATEALLRTRGDALEAWQQLELQTGMPLAAIRSEPAARESAPAAPRDTPGATP
jgi:cobalt-zinc-cadmium efflux system outer membrane protein